MDKTDEKDRITALDINHSFIVRSPAGSGKTQLLTLRFLALLSHVHKDPEEVLAITFTRKAAAEMRERILQALLKATQPIETTDPFLLQTCRLAEQVLVRDKQENWNLLANPNRLRIQTIDSFCSYLTKKMPISAHFSAYAKIINDPWFLYLQAARETLNEIDQQESWSVAIENLLLHFHNSHERIEKLLADMLAKRDQWVHYLPHLQSEDRSGLEEGLAQIVQEHLTQLATQFPQKYHAEILSLLRYAAEHLDVNHPLNGFTKRDQFPTDILEDYPFWIAITDFLLTKEGQWRKIVTQRQGFPALRSAEAKAMKAKAMKAKAMNMLNALCENETLRKLLMEISFLPPLHYTDQQWMAVTAWLKIFPLLLAHLQILFQREGVVDYVEVSLNALQALGETDAPSDLALFLDQQIHHILIDEFQDTSFSQWRLLEKMTAGWQSDDGRTLFLVGDPMQSIYRFRKAEVGLFFRAAREGIHAISLSSLTLQMNFRSQANLVHWVSDIFTGIMPSRENLRFGAIKFIASIPKKSAEIGQLSVQWHPFFNANPTAQASRIVNIIHSIFAHTPDAKIAILVQARSHAQTILALLRTAKISYQAVELERLESRPVILDLLALTRAFLNPADRIAWLSVLRAPWCGLLLTDIYKIAGIYPEKTILERIENIDELGLTEDGFLRLAYFAEVMNKNLNQRGGLSLRATIEKIWYELNAHVSLTDPNEKQNSKVFFNVLDELEMAGDIKDISELQQRLSSCYATAIFTGDSPTVEIMTIHKAKGLEFDHVILPSLEKKTAYDDAQLLLWSEYAALNGRNYLILGPIKDTESKIDPVYRYLQRQESEKSQNEMRRLLYVAVTRAKESLHLLGSVVCEEDCIKSPASQSFLGQIWSTAEAIFKEALPEKLMSPILVEEEIACANQKLKRLKSTFFTPVNHLIFARSIQNESPIKLINQKKYFAQSVGTVIHQHLQYLTADFFDGIQSFEPTASRQAFLELGVSLTEIDKAVNLVECALKNILICERGRWIFSSEHTHIRSEYPLNYLEEKRVVLCVIDRTFIDSNGVRWIIDFKTHMNCIENLEDQKKAYQPQLERYAKLMQNLDDRPIRLGLYFPLQSAWIDWEVKSQGI